MAANTVHREAHRLLHNPKIATRVQAIRAAHNAQYPISRELLTAYLMETLELARGEHKTDLVRKSVMDLAKLHGLLSEQMDLHNNTSRQTVMNDVTLNGESLAFEIGQRI